jgi:hypothetical protein
MMPFLAHRGGHRETSTQRRFRYHRDHIGSRSGIGGRRATQSWCAKSSTFNEGFRIRRARHARFRAVKSTRRSCFRISALERATFAPHAHVFKFDCGDKHVTAAGKGLVRMRGDFGHLRKDQVSALGNLVTDFVGDMGLILLREKR